MIDYNREIAYYFKKFRNVHFMKQKNLFIAFTPYHFITAYSLVREEFPDNNFDNEIYFLKSDKTNYIIDSTRDNFNGNINRFENIEFVGLIKELEQKDFSRFFFFQENSILNKYLAYKLKKKGTLICLAPDGTKPYCYFNKKHELLSVIKDTITDYRFLAKTGLKLPKIILSKYYKYGATNFLDEIWLQYPELFDRKINKTIGKIVKMPALTRENIVRLMQICNFANTQLTKTEKIILYFNQPFYTKGLIAKEFEILEALSNQFADTKINIKLHPSTSPEIIEKMKSLPYVLVINDNLPAEFYLGIASNSILLTGWSTALMHDITHQNNNSYYLYPLYKDVDDKLLSQISLIGFPHLSIIDNVAEIKFANE